MKNRIQEISVFNVMLCFFVVMIHVLAYAIAELSPGTEAYNIIKYDIVFITQRLMTFAVQGFILLSGVKLFLSGKDGIKYTAYLKKRFFGILLPYAVCYTVYYIFYIIVYDYPVSDFGFILENFVFGSLGCHFYFIPLLVQFDLLLPFWRKIVHNCSPVFVIPISLVASSVFEVYLGSMLQVFTDKTVEIYNDRIFTTYLAFWLIGCYIGKYYDTFKELARTNYKFITVTFVLSALSFSVYCHYAYNYLKLVPAISQIRYIYLISAILFFFATFLKLPEGILAKIPLLSFADKYSYDIYLWHILVMLVADNFIINKYSITNMMTAFLIRTAFVCIGTLILVLSISYIRKFISSAFKKTPKRI